MRRLAVLILVIISGLFTACSEKESKMEEPDELLPVINGYFARNEAGESMGIIGNMNPNVNLGTNTNLVDSDYFITFFPNPAINFASVYMKSPGQDEIKKIWIVPAVFDPEYEPSDDETYEPEINILNEIAVLQTETTMHTVFFDLTELQSGYYRIYVEVAEYILYDNIVIDKDFNPTGK
ncbi:MAG: hypothetical protein K0B37_01815 [Bacteroidales bacterium]|nr:hypothetical protein [Bacteroidales bacterium]